VVGCGVELMSSTKMGSDTDLFGPDTPSSAAFKAGFPFKLLHQGVSAELLAAKYGVTRQECDDFAVRSHTLAHKAIQEGRFKSQIVPFQAKQADGTVKLLEQDEGVKFPVDHAKLTSLKAIFKPEGGGVVTAGNASQISDGAAAVLLASERYLKTSGLKPRAAILSRVAVGSDPEIMLDGVIPATHRALKKAGLSLKDMDVIEINEAFASVVLGWAKEVKADMTKVNPNGGAIALGHPLGATGAFLTCKALHELERTNGRYALITACIGHGQAVATVIERV
jgi:acetyl-CoA acyltransferase